jgi:hypothetical protein
MLTGFRTPGLVDDTLQALRRADAAIRAARASVAADEAPARRDAIDGLARRTPPDLFERALIELRQADANRTAEERQREEARLAREAKDAEQARGERELRDRAEQTVRAAQQVFAAGDRDAAAQLLERFTPPHPIVTAQLEEFKLESQVRDLVTAAEAAFTAGRIAEAKATTARALQLRREDAAGHVLLGRIKAAQRSALVHRVRRIGIRVAVPSALVAALAVGAYEYWPAFQKNPIVVPSPPAKEAEKPTTPALPDPSQVQQKSPAPVPVPSDVTIDALPWANFQIKPLDANSTQKVVAGVTPYRGQLMPGKYVVELENGGLTQARTEQVEVTGEPLKRAFRMPGFDPERAVTALLGPDR